MTKELKLEPVIVKNQADIVQALKPFVDDKHQLRASLLEGFELVKKRKLFNEKTDSGLDVDQMHFWVDDLIKQRMGGKRKGMTVVWELPEGKFQFEPLTKKLSDA